MQKICVIVPVLNEAESVKTLIDTCMGVFNKQSNYVFQLLFIDDGSTDNTIAEIEKFMAEKLPVGYVRLSRNYGHQSALEAGLAVCVSATNRFKPDAIITMDGDLQHPPAEIPNMLKAFEQGADVVQMKRTNTGDSFRGMLSLGYYTFFSWISDSDLVPNAADFRLLSRKVAEQIVAIPGKGKLLRAIIPSLGFKQVHLEYVQPLRKYGKPSYSLFALYELSLHTTFKFSRFPAHFTTLSGVLFLLAGIVMYILYSFNILPGTNHSFFLLVLLFIGGIVLSATGILCWYLYFILEQVRHDPSFVIDKTVYPNHEQ
jgi:dolichol-phosphate mannosyltransferase